jgi:hypothetical protein
MIDKNISQSKKIESDRQKMLDFITRGGCPPEKMSREKRWGFSLVCYVEPRDRVPINVLRCDHVANLTHYIV